MRGWLPLWIFLSGGWTLPKGCERFFQPSPAGSEVEVRVAHVVPAAGDYTVVLVEKNQREPRRALLIWVGSAEGVSIQQAIAGFRPPRPMTHDLFRNTLDRLQSRVERLTITKLEANTFYARLDLRQLRRKVSMDCRPSDGIALALRAGAPIRVARKVWEEACINWPPGEREERSPRGRDEPVPL